VDFSGGKAGFVRIEFGAERLQNSVIGNEIEGKYVLQGFSNCNYRRSLANINELYLMYKNRKEV
jgi:hypothetical protein